MSLFSTRERWAAPSANAAESDEGCLVAAPLIGTDEGMVVAQATFDGRVRAYRPEGVGFQARKSCGKAARLRAGWRGS